MVGPIPEHVLEEAAQKAIDELCEFYGVNYMVNDRDRLKRTIGDMVQDTLWCLAIVLLLLVAACGVAQTVFINLL